MIVVNETSQFQHCTTHRKGVRRSHEHCDHGRGEFERRHAARGRAASNGRQTALVSAQRRLIRTGNLLVKAYKATTAGIKYEPT